MWEFMRSKADRDKDRAEADYLVDRYGEEAQAVAERRAVDTSLDKRSRRHWERMARLLR